jgi:hypothetical protein
MGLGGNVLGAARSGGFGWRRVADGLWVAF